MDEISGDIYRQGSQASFDRASNVFLFMLSGHIGLKEKLACSITSNIWNVETQ